MPPAHVPVPVPSRDGTNTDALASALLDAAAALDDQRLLAWAAALADGDQPETR